MNRIFRTVWNAVRGKLVAVEESRTGHSQAGGCRRRGALVAAAVAAAAPGFAGAVDIDVSDPSNSFVLFQNDRVSNGRAEVISKGTILLSKGNSLTVEEGGYFMTNFEGSTFYSDADSTVNVARYDPELLKKNPYAGDAGNFELWRWENVGATAVIGSAHIAEEYVQHDGSATFNGLLTAKNFDVRGGKTTFDGETFDVTGSAKVSGGTVILKTGTLSFKNAGDALSLENEGKFVVQGGKLSASGGVNVSGEGAVFRVEAANAVDAGTLVSVTGGAYEAAAAGLSFSGDFTKGVIRTVEGGDLALAKRYEVKEGMTFANATAMNFAEGVEVKGGLIDNDGTVTAKNAVLSSGVIDNAGSFSIKETFGMTGGTLRLSEGSSVNVDGALQASGGTIEGAGLVKGKTVALSGELALQSENVDLEGETVSTDGTFATGDVTATTKLDVAGGALRAGAVKLAGAGSVAEGASLSADFLSFAGTVTNAGSLAAGVLDETSAGRIENRGSLTIDTAGKTAGATIAMVGSGAQLVVKKEGFFTDTHFEVKDGAQMKLSDYGMSTLGAGNTYVVEHASWTGSVAPGENSHVDASAFDGMSKLVVANLTSEGEVTVKTGGLVETSTVNLTKADTVHLAGGALMTKLGGMFEGVTSETILVDAESPDDTVEIDTKLLGVSDIGDIKGGVAEGIDWQSGTIAFSDSFVSLSAIASSQAAIGKAAGGASSSVQVVFTGDVLEGAAGGGITIDTLEELKAEQEAVSGSAVMNPGVVLAGSVLNNVKDGKSSIRLVFGESEEKNTHSIDLSIGFAKIANAHEVQVGSGRELVLAGVSRADENTWSSANAQLLSTASRGGEMTVDKGAKLTFGTYGLGYQTAGWVGNLVNNGTFSVKAGDFGIKETYETSGVTDVQKGSTLHANEFVALEGSVTTVSEGHLDFEFFAVDPGASLEMAGSSTLVTTGGRVDGTLTTGRETSVVVSDLTVGEGGVAELLGGARGDILLLLENAEVTLSGKQEWAEIASAGLNGENQGVITVDEAGELALLAADYRDLVEGKLVNKGTLDFSAVKEFSVGGDLVNLAAKGEKGGGAKYDDLAVDLQASDRNLGYEEGDLLTVRGTWQNGGVAVWNGLAVDAFNEADNDYVFADNLKGATLTAGSKGMRLEGGKMTNAGKIDSTAGLVTVSGAMSSNAAGGEWAYDDLTVSAGSSVNDGYEHGDVLSVSDEGSWTDNGRSEWTGVAVSGGTALVGTDGTLTVGSSGKPGSFEISGGNFTNLGHTDTTNVATATISGGVSTNGSEATKDTAHRHYANLTITGGSSVNNATEEGNFLNVSSEGSWTNNHVANWTQVNFNNASGVNNGVLTGTVTVGGALTGTGSIQGNADNSVSLNGTIEQDSITTGTFVSSGGHSRVDVGTLVALKEIRNQKGNVIEADSVSTKDFTNAGTAVIAGELDAVTTTNSGSLTLGTVSNFNGDKTYIHDGADAALTVSDGSHFTNTNLVFTGGGNVYVSETAGNQPNFSGLDGSLGTNTVTISGDAPYDMTGDHTASYPEGTTTVFVDRLGSETDLTLEEGGRLVVGTIDFDGTENTTKLAGGALSTSLSQLFDDLKNKYLLIDADSPDDTTEVSSAILGVESVGDLKDSVLAGIDFEKGAIGVSDKAVSAGAVTSVIDAVAEAAGEHAADVDVVFEGDLFGESGVVGDLTLSDVSDLYEEQQGVEGSAVTNPGVILASTSLDAKNDADGIVTIGGENADVAGSIGFESIKNADGVQVNDGRGTLVGGKLDPEKTGDNFDWSDGNRLIQSETAGSGGTVVIGQNGRYDFGSKGTVDKHTGWVDSVSNDGVFNVTNGEYGIKGDFATTADGESTVQDDAVLHVGGIGVAGELVNDGVIVVDGSEGSQQVAVEEGGSFVQNGTLDMNGKDALISGSVTTSNGAGTDTEGSFWHDMTVTGTGSNHVASGGREEGDRLDLTQGGDSAWVVDKGGESHWNEVADASGSNAGSVSVGDDAGREDGVKAEDSSFNVAAGDDYVNTGSLDLVGAGNVEIDGTLTTGEGGETKYDDVTVGSEGQNHVASNGSETGDILDLTQGGENAWVVDEGGESHWNRVWGASGSNDGAVTVGRGDHADEDGDGKAETGDFSVASGGDYVNTGSLDLTGAGNVEVDGTLTTGNGGETRYDDLSVGSGGTVTVAEGGSEEGDVLDLAQGGYVVEEGGKADWNQIWVGSEESQGGSLTNRGDVTVDKVQVGSGGSFVNNGTVAGGELNVVSGGVVNVEGGKTDFDKTVIKQNGWLVVGNGETPAESDKAVFDFSTADTIEGDVFVVNNGELVFSGEGTDETFDDLIKAPQLPDAPVKVVVGGTVHVGSHGSLNIGNSSYTKPAPDAQEGDRGTANVETGTGNLFFGSDSTTVISVPGIGKGPAFTTDSTSAAVTVEEGATLILGNVSEAGQYVITEGFLTQNGTLVNGWLDEEHLFALNEDGTGLDWVLDLGFDSDSIWVDVSYADIRTEYPDMVLPENVNDSLKHGSDPRGPQDVFINEILKDKTIGVDEKTRIVNSVAQIAAAGGVFGSGFDAVTATVDALEGRASFMGETFTHDGRMVSGQTGTDLWAVALGGSHSVDSNTASGRMSGGYDADTHGFMAGLDHKIAGTDWRTGAALSYRKGDLRSNGDWLSASTDYDAFGIQAYANYAPNRHVNLIGSLGYFRNGSETTMGLPAASKTFREASAEIDLDMVAAAVRMEGRFDVGSVSVIPHAGVRMLITNAGSYATKLDGKTAFESDADSLVTGQLPVGVALRGDFTASNGWTWRPTADVTVTPQFGDVDVLTHVRGADAGTTEKVEFEVIGHFVATGSLGMQVEKDGLAIGAGYGFTGGMSGRADHAFNVNVRWRF